MNAKKKSNSASLTFEERMQRLQSIVSAMEGGNVPLEESVALYKEGMELSQMCRKQLEKARHDITLYTENGEKPFAADAVDDNK